MALVKLAALVSTESAPVSGLMARDSVVLSMMVRQLEDEVIEDEGWQVWGSGIVVAAKKKWR